MSCLIFATLSSCRTMRNMQRMTTITSSTLFVPSIMGHTRSRPTFATSSSCKSSDKITEKPVSSSGAAVTSRPGSKDEKEELEEVSEVILKEIPDSKIHWEYQQSSETARVYDRKPIKIKCKEGRMYMWCSCGNSKNQPFCDGTHRHVQFGTSLKPIPWSCKKTGYYWFCNCKKSGKKVFCDGTHIQLMQDPNVVPIIKH